MTPETLSAAVGCTLLTASRFAQPLTQAMSRWGIDTPLRQGAFLGQIAHESSKLQVLEEKLNYSAERLMQVWPRRFPTLDSAKPYANSPFKLAELVYQNRMENDVPGEAFLYRGRGLKQLTGEANYLAYSMEADNNALLDPDILLQPHYAADSAGWFWHRNKCNAFADKRDWTGLTKRINGGTVGLAERITATQRALKVLGAL